MKKVKVALVGVSFLISGFFLLSGNNESDSTLEMVTNIEALARGEGGEKCSDSCKEWKGNSGGGIACDCGRYTGSCKNRC